MRPAAAVGVHFGRTRVVVAILREGRTAVIGEAEVPADVEDAARRAFAIAQAAFSSGTTVRAVVAVPPEAGPPMLKRARGAAELAGFEVLAVVTAPIAALAAEDAGPAHEVVGVYEWDAARFEYSLVAGGKEGARVIASLGEDAVRATAIVRTLEIAWKTHIRERRAARDVGRVLLVGERTGAAIVEAVEKFFHKAPMRSDEPRHTVASGAAVKADAIARARGDAPAVFAGDAAADFAPDEPPTARTSFDEEAPTNRRDVPAPAPTEDSVEIVLDDMILKDGASLTFTLSDLELVPAERERPRVPSARPPPGAFFSYVGPHPLATPAPPPPPSPPRGPFWGSMPEEHSWVEVPATLGARENRGDAREGPRVTALPLVVDDAEGRAEVTAAPGTALPYSWRRLFPATADGATSVTLRFAQGHDPVFARNARVGEIVVEGLAPLRRGYTAVLASLELGADGTLGVVATDPRTGAVARARFRGAVRTT